MTQFLYYEVGDGIYIIFYVELYIILYRYIYFINTLHIYKYFIYVYTSYAKTHRYIARKWENNVSHAL